MDPIIEIIRRNERDCRELGKIRKLGSYKVEVCDVERLSTRTH